LKGKAVMCISVFIASLSTEDIKAILILVFVAIALIGPLIYSILSGEKFGWFRDPELKRPDKNQWQQFRDKADQIIEGSLEIDGSELYELAKTMQVEVEYHKRNKGTVEYEKDRERITGLSKKLQGMDLRVEPFDSLTEHLKEDGLTEQAQKLHLMIHTATDASLSQMKKEFRAELAKIKDENWDILGPDTKTAFKQSVKILKYNPLTSICVYAALIIFGLGLRFYHSIIEEKGYKFYRDNPIWIAVFVLIIGVPALILVIKFLAWKYSTCENPYRFNQTDEL
jgi:hypothetical protein